MEYKPLFRRITHCLALAVLLAACATPTGPVTGPGATSTVARETPRAATVPARDPLTTGTSEPTAMETGTPAGTSAVPTSQVNLPAVITSLPKITAENAQSLKALVIDLSTGLPGDAFSRGLAWPAAGIVDVVGAGTLLSVYFAQAEPYYDAPLTLNAPGTIFDVSSDSTRMAAGSLGAPATLYRIDGEVISTLDEPSAYGAGFSADGAWLVVPSSETWAVSVYDGHTGRRITRLTGFETAAPYYRAVIAPGGKSLAWMARATLQFQDVTTGTMGPRLSFEDFIMTDAFSPSGDRLAVFAAQTLHLIDPATSETVASLAVTGPVRALAFSPDGTLLAAAYGNGIQVWDGLTLEPVATLAEPAGPFSLLAFSPDGSTLAAIDENKRLLLWQDR